jgi:amphi-Trp domain-containing protein
MADETLFESERRRSRADIAGVFRSLATALENDGPVTLEDGELSVRIEPPEQPLFEIEVERESGKRNLELELEWDEHDEGESTSSAAEGESTESDDTGAEPAQSLGRFEVFRDRASEWRWRLVHRNGNIIATGGEGYTSKQNALKGMRSVMQNAPDADVVSE